MNGLSGLLSGFDALSLRFETLKEDSGALTVKKAKEIRGIWNQSVADYLQSFLLSLHGSNRKYYSAQILHFRNFFDDFIGNKSSDFDAMIQKISNIRMVLCTSLKLKFSSKASFLTQSICDSILDGVIETGTLASYKKQLAEANIQAGCVTKTIQANIQSTLQKIEMLEKEASSQTGDDAS